MIKKLFTILLLAIIFPVAVHAQSSTPNLSPPVSPQASSSPVLRNRLQLLKSPLTADNKYRQLDKRFTGFLNRLKNINLRFEKRLAKLIVNKTTLDKLKNSLDGLNTEIGAHEKEKGFLLEDWTKLINSNSSDQYPAFKKRITAFFASLDSLLADEKSLLKEIKKYKSAPEPTVKEATSSNTPNL